MVLQYEFFDFSFVFLCSSCFAILLCFFALFVCFHCSFFLVFLLFSLCFSILVLTFSPKALRRVLLREALSSKAAEVMSVLKECHQRLLK